MAFISKSLTKNIIDDKSSLLALKSHLTLTHNHILSQNWSTNTPVCGWVGVTCDSRHHRVVSLDISNMGLEGTLPSQLGNLSFLVSLEASNNLFRGPIPSTIFNISSLRFLSLENNTLSGSLPMNICHRATGLKVLRVSINKLNGEIPRGVSACSRLEMLFLNYNDFDGTIPGEIGSLNRLQILSLRDNNLKGTIPETIFNISTLVHISVANNSLSGTIPANMCSRLHKLERLYFSKNELHGNIPTSIGECSSLRLLDMYKNKLHGHLPRQIGNLTMLEVLDLGTNSFSGEIPEELGNLKELESLLMEFNGLSGSIPWGIFNISKLEQLSLELNYFSGTLPPSMGHHLPNLEYLNLGQNHIRGAIPEYISNASNLVFIELGENELSGLIPNSIGNLPHLKTLSLFSNNLRADPQFSLITSLANCRNIQRLKLASNPLNTVFPNSIGNLSTTLQVLYANDCKIRGKIPGEIGNLSNLYILHLAGNDISGSLRGTMQAIQNLQLLEMTQNRLTGAFPHVVCELINLSLMSLEANQLSGPIPDCLANVSSLREIYLSKNEFTVLPSNIWSLENLLRIQVMSNNLSGNLPKEIGNARTTILINLSNNKISGEIPGTIAGLTDLMDFSVAHNKLRGSIPGAFGKLLDLHSLDLSDNNFSGTIPVSLEKLREMKHFNVSSNRLTGKIPSGGPFATFNFESFSFNDGLCGPPRLHVPPCPANTLHKPERNRVVMFVLLSLAVLVVLIAIVIVSLISKKNKRKAPGDNELELLSGITVPRFSNYELQRATNGFDESNLLGNGSFGAVYRGTLTGGTNVAVKVFHFIHERENKSFDTECEVLRNIRHRNLTKVLGSCSSSDFKALVLEYMPNGSLNQWLYSHNHFLDLIQRVSVMIDVAAALDYLHNGYSEPIIHCDLKPNNVLLDADMVAHLSDFGSAKLLGEENSIAITNSLATIGYIAPEYGQEGVVSTRSDMYSFGIMLLEVFTRKQPGDEIFGEDLSIKRWVQNSLPANLEQIIDSNLLSPEEENYDEKVKCLFDIFELGVNCSADSPRERTSIERALPALQKIKSRLLSLYSRTHTKLYA